MTKRYLLLLLLALLAGPHCPAFAQVAAPPAPSALPAPLPRDSAQLAALLARPGLSPSDRARVLEGTASLYYQTDGPRARALAEQALPLAQRHGPPGLEVLLLTRLASVNGMLGDGAAAQRYAEQALARALAAPAPDLMGEVYFQLSIISEKAHDWPGAVAYLEKALQAIDVQRADARVLPGVLMGLCRVNLRLNHLPAAGKAFRRGLALARTRPDKPMDLFFTLASWGFGQIKHRPDSAVYYLSRALPVARQARNSYAENYALLGLSGAYEAQQNWPAMRSAASQALRLARQRRSAAEELDALKQLATALRHSPQPGLAFDTLSLALDLGDSLFNQQRREALAGFEGNARTLEQKASIRELGLKNAAATAQGRLQQRLLLLGGLVLLALAALAAVLFNRYRLKQRAAAALEVKNAEITRRDAEKATLLREMHHRVKNNLQVVSSLLSLQGRQLEDVGARDALRESKSRVEAMALLHQKLYQHEELRHIALPDYVRLLVATVLGTYGHDPDQVATLDVAEVTADIEVALPLGLLLNELLTNACKYALPQAAGAPHLAIRLRPDGAGLRLTVADNGPGLPPPTAAGSAPADAARSFGQRLLGLLTEQLEGRLTWAVAPGGGAVAELYVPSTTLATAG